MKTKLVSIHERTFFESASSLRLPESIRQLYKDGRSSVCQNLVGAAPSPRLGMNISLVVVVVALLSVVYNTIAPVQAGEVGPVEVFAQPKPGQPPAIINMTVHPAPVSPPSVSSDQIRLSDDELVIGIVIGQTPIAYPVRFMAMVEVVNDRVADVPIAATWCPLSGTGAIFSREVDGKELTFDFGTGLKGDNLLIVDRETRSVWSQLQQQAISGMHKDNMISSLPSIQTTWKAWKSSYPDTEVMVFPGHRGYPYFYHDFRDPGPRRTGHDTSQLGLGLVIDGESRFYPFAALAVHQVPIVDVINDQQVQIYFDPDSLTAWATDKKSLLISGMLAYQRAWLEFFPDTYIFR